MNHSQQHGHHHHDGGIPSEYLWAFVIGTTIGARRARMAEAQRLGVEPRWDDAHPFRAWGQAFFNMGLWVLGIIIFIFVFVSLPFFVFDIFGVM